MIVREEGQSQLTLSQLFRANLHHRDLTDWIANEKQVGFAGSARLYRAIEPSVGYALLQASPPPLAVPGAGEIACIADSARYRGDVVSDEGDPANSHALIQVVAFDVPVAWRGEIDAWYAREHIALLMRAPGWLRARRLAVTARNGRPFTSIAIHDLRDRAVMDSPEREIARTTPWRGRFSTEPWFEGSGRWLYEALGDT